MTGIRWAGAAAGAVLGAAVAVLSAPGAQAAPALAPTVAPAAATVTLPLPNHAVTGFDSGTVAVPPSTVLGVSWAGAAVPGTRVSVRVLESGRWSTPAVLGLEPATGGRTAASPLAARGATALRVQVTTASGTAPRDVRVVAVGTSAAPGDTSGPALSRSAITATTAAAPAAPSVITRAMWGADESRRTGAPVLGQTVTVGILHHTTGWTTYSKAEAYQLVRALYDWYTTPVAQGGPGLPDIAYNALVDRYGRIFEGRAGGLANSVVGQHTVGFNDGTVGVAVLGDFEVNPLPADTGDAVVAQLGRLFAWKLAAGNHSPLARTLYRSTAAGSDSRYAAGTEVTVPVIAAASDLLKTTSPGRSLTARLPEVRSIAAWLMPTVARQTPAVTAPAAVVDAAGAHVSAVSTRPLAWTLTVSTPCRTDTVRTLSGRQSLPGRLSTVWDLQDAAGFTVPPGRYTLTVAGTTVDGGAAVRSSSIVAVTGGATGPVLPCPHVVRVAGSSAAISSVRIGRWSEPAATSAVLVSSGTSWDVGYEQVAAPLAHARHVPLLGVTPTAVPTAVMSDLVSRGVRSVVLVGGTGRIGTAVEQALRARGIAFTRVGGADLATTAAAVARAMAPRASAGAVLVNPVDSPAVSALAAAAAARTGRPVLIVGATSVPTATTAALRSLGLTSNVLVAPTTSASETVRRAVTAQRVWLADPVALALRLGGAGTGDRAVLIAPGAHELPSLAAATGRVLLPIGTTGPGASVTAWLAARPALTDLAAAMTTSQAPDTALTALARALDQRDSEPLTAAALSTAGTAKRGAAVAPAVPDSFTVNGSGWGHGVGLSQAGALGQAREGRTGEQIAAYYFTGTAVTAVDDSADIAIAILQRVPTIVMRAEALAPGEAVGGIRVQAPYRSTVFTRRGDILRFRFADGKVVLYRTRSGVTTRMWSAARARVTWAGTRAAGGLGTTPTLLNVAGPGETLRDAQHRYRFGTLDIKPITVRGDRPAGLQALNNVRIHDEYLYGIAEVDASWPIEALRAQILASRSYALAMRAQGLRAGCLCHSDDGDGPYYDQTFLGWVKVDEGEDSPAWRHAVDTTAADATHGLTVTYKGAPFQAFFTDSTGGRTRNLEDVWGGDDPLPYLKGVDDHWSLDPRNSPSFAHWRPRVRTQADMAELFGLADVASVAVTARQSSGTALQYTATSSTGATATVTGRQFSRFMNLPSLWVWSVVANPPA